MIENSFPQQVVIVVSFIIPDDTVHKLLNVSPSLLMAEETLGWQDYGGDIDYDGRYS